MCLRAQYYFQLNIVYHMRRSVNNLSMRWCAIAKHHSYREIQETIILVNDDIDDRVIPETHRRTNVSPNKDNISVI